MICLLCDRSAAEMHHIAIRIINADGLAEAHTELQAKFGQVSACDT